MDKKDVQEFVKNKLKPLGFKKRGNLFYKIISDDYWVTIYMDHHPYCKGYFFQYGGRYEPNTSWRTPFNPPFDWSKYFFFTVDPNDNLSQYINDSARYSVARALITN